MKSLLKKFSAAPSEPSVESRLPSKAAAPPATHDAGWWHESSYDLQHGVQVTEWFWSDVEVDFVRASDR